MMAEELIECVTLSDEDILVNQSLFRRGVVPVHIADLSPAQSRLIAYKKLFRVLHGIGQTGVQVVTPACCRKLISTTFPDN